MHSNRRVIRDKKGRVVELDRITCECLVYVTVCVCLCGVVGLGVNKHQGTNPCALLEACQ